MMRKLARPLKPVAALLSGLLLASGTLAGLPDKQGLASPADLAAACRDKDGWRDPAPPVRIAGEVYFVGTCGITVLLVKSSAGHVLIDTAEAEAVPQILSNVKKLGADPRDIAWLLASHAHYDHTGGHALMQQLTGARIAALPDQARELERGEPMTDDPQHGLIKGITPVKVDRRLADGETLKIGTTRITAFATPGHTRGSTSWAIRTCAKRDCAEVLLADSISPVSADAYRFSSHPEWVERFRSGVDRIARLPCSMLVTPHPGSSQLFERLAAPAGQTDPAACQNYAAQGLDWMERRLRTERAGS